MNKSIYYGFAVLLMLAVIGTAAAVDDASNAADTDAVAYGCAGQGAGFADADGDGVCDNFDDADGDGINDNCGSNGPGAGSGTGNGACGGNGYRNGGAGCNGGGCGQ